MKKTTTRIALALAFSLATPIAYADSTPSPSLSPIEQYRADRDAYVAALKSRMQQINQINSAFKRACDKAKKDFKIAIRSAKSPDQKNAVVAARDAVISAAIIARDDAITSLGPEPTAPIEPNLANKIKGKNKSR